MADSKRITRPIPEATSEQVAAHKALVGVLTPGQLIWLYDAALDLYLAAVGGGQTLGEWLGLTDLDGEP